MKNSDPTMTPAANFLEVRKLAMATHQAVTQSARRQWGTLMDKAADLAADCCKLTGEANAWPNEQEIRSVFRTLTAKERGQIFRAAVKRDDRELVGSILRGNQLTTGMSRDLVAAYRQEAESHMAAEVVRGRDACIAAAEAIKELPAESERLLRASAPDDIYQQIKTEQEASQV